jgi:hypothetical protein
MQELEPVICTLDAAAHTDQSARWMELIRRAATARDATADGVRLVFQHDAEVELELRALVAVEQDCCRWATWTISREGEGITLHIASAGDGVAAIQAMLA